MSRWPARGGALLAGALPALAFPGPNLALLAWVALVPALLVLRGSRSGGDAAVRGWCVGVGLVAATQYWVAPNLVFFFPLGVAALALLWSAWGVLAWTLLRGVLTARRAVAAVIGVPAGWVLIEAVRSWQWLGGPWALFGATQWRHPAVLALAAVGGVWLVGFAVVAVNTGIVVAVASPGASGRAVGGAAVVFALAAGPAWYSLGPVPATAGRLRVALIQVETGLADNMIRQEELTRAAAPGADLVVWGESSVDVDPGERPEVLARLTTLSREVGADLLVNVDAHVVGTDAHVVGTDAIAKTATLIDGTGVVATYRKTRLVPFGEYIPFRDRLGWLSRITAATAQNRVPGHELVVMDTGRTRIGPLISFELTFPDLARQQAKGGAALLVYQTSTSTFQGSSGPAQLTSVGAVRAAETGRPVAVAALTGVSAAFDARGRVLAWLPAAGAGSLVVDLEPSSGRTPYVRFGDWLPAVCAVAVIAIAGGTVVRRVRSSRG
ncbi:apolipoprotein N-acyltransferase [Rhodococcus sp. NPDC003348]